MTEPELDRLTDLAHLTELLPYVAAGVLVLSVLVAAWGWRR